MELDQLKWTDVRQLGVLGKGWTDTESPYDRLPARAKDLVRDEVWNLSRHSSGLRVQFVTDSPVIAADWTLPADEPIAMDHMPATGKSGLDLYTRHKGSWHWLGVARLDVQGRNRRILAQGLHPARRECMLYLPLYNRVESLSIGIVPEASLTKPRPRSRKLICYYGTSIVQGGCASRPGMTYPAILGRVLDVDFLNLGFSGNAQMEPELAQLLAELDPAVYVLDALPNVPVKEVVQRAEPFIRTLRAVRPKTPIVLVENIVYQNACLVKERMLEVTTRNRGLRKVYEKLRREKMKGLRYVPSKDLLGHDGEATVDGAHFTDLGFMRMAQGLLPVLKQLL